MYKYLKSREIPDDVSCQVTVVVVNTNTLYS